MKLINIKIFRYCYEYWDEDDLKVNTKKGYVAGLSYGNAADRLVSIETDPNGKSDIISMNLWEVDCYDNAILEDEMINDIFREEEMLEGK